MLKLTSNELRHDLKFVVFHKHVAMSIHEVVNDEDTGMT